MGKHIMPLLLVCAAILTAIAAQAMESNLALPYGSKPSPPYKMELYFYSRDSENLLFDKQKEIRIICHAGLRSVGLTWTVSRNMFNTPFLSGEGEPLVDNSYIIRIPAAKLRPGFYDINVKFDCGDPNYKESTSKPDSKPNQVISGLCTFGYKIEKMPIRLTRPADFEAFWKKGMDDLAKVPLNPELGEVKTYKGKEIDKYNVESAALPGDYDPKGHKYEEVEACKLTYSSLNNMRVHGWLAKPVGNGPFPAMLVLPGAGFAARPAPLEHARHGYVALDIQIHGQEVDLPGKYPQIPGYYSNPVFEPINAYYYYQVYLNCIQAVTYLASRPDVDPTRIVVVGGSQGGRMSVVVAALDKRIAATVPAIAHNGNMPYLKWFDACNKAKTDGMDRNDPPALADTPENRCLAYYDITNFAQDVKCPVFMNMGLTDHVSYPAGVYATFKTMSSKDKQLVPMPNLAHDWFSEFDRRAWRWLDALWAKQK